MTLGYMCVSKVLTRRPVVHVDRYLDVYGINIYQLAKCAYRFTFASKVCSSTCKTVGATSIRLVHNGSSRLCRAATTLLRKCQQEAGCGAPGTLETSRPRMTHSSYSFAIANGCERYSGGRGPEQRCQSSAHAYLLFRLRRAEHRSSHG